MSDEASRTIDAILKGVNESLSFRPGAHLRADLQMDSLDVMTFFFDVEREFGVKIPEEDIESRQLLDLDRLLAYLQERAQAQ